MNIILHGPCDELFRWIRLWNDYLLTRQLECMAIQTNATLRDQVTTFRNYSFGSSEMQLITWEKNEESMKKSN